MPIDTDSTVILRGGHVVNDPDVTVLTLDVLGTDPTSADADVPEAQCLLTLSTATQVEWVTAETEAWLTRAATARGIEPRSLIRAAHDAL